MYSRREKAAVKCTDGLQRSANWDLGGWEDTAKTKMLPHVKLVASLHNDRARVWQQVVLGLLEQAWPKQLCRS